MCGGVQGAPVQYRSEARDLHLGVFNSGDALRADNGQFLSFPESMPLGPVRHLGGALEPLKRPASGASSAAASARADRAGIFYMSVLDAVETGATIRGMADWPSTDASLS